jgi:type II secretory pathway component PulF
MANTETVHPRGIRLRDLSFSVIHTFGWMLLLVLVPMFVVKEFKEAWSEFEIRLNPLSQLLLGWSDRVIALWFIWVPLILFVVVATGVLLLVLRKSSWRTAGKITSLLLLATTFLAIAVGVGLPTLQIIRGL